MKKGRECFRGIPRWLCHLLLSFKIMLLTVSFSFAQQNSDRVTVDMKNVSLTEVLNEIKRQTKINFMFSNDDLKDVQKKNYSMKDVAVETAIQMCLEGTDLTYEIAKNVVVIKRRVVSNVQNGVTQIVIQGTVSDEKKSPLPGVTVVLKNTNMGVVTNVDGTFKMSLTQKDTSAVLVFSFIGMETAEVKIGKKREFNIVLKEKETALEDVVVTGYANISRHSFTGNAVTVTKAELKAISSTNILKALEVLDPSFRLKADNVQGSNPNALPEISIRGNSGLGLTELESGNVSRAALQNNPSLPTFIMDGFEVDVTKLFDMDIDRIESITILKDAAATAMYGSRAANGVVVITTVAPKIGEILVSYSYALNLEIPDLDDYNLANAREKIELEKAAGLYDDYGKIHQYHERLRLVERGYNTDWMMQPLQNAANNRHYFRIEGGNEGLRYGIDVSYYGEKGVMKGSERNRTGINLDLQYHVKKLRFSNVAGFTGISSEDSPYGDFSQYSQMNPYYYHKDSDGNLVKFISLPNGERFDNPLYEATLGSYSKTKRKEFINNFSVHYYFTPEFYVKGNLALTYITGNSESYSSPDSYAYRGAKEKGSMSLSNNSVTTLDGGMFFYYNNVINNHSVNATFGVNMKQSSDEDFRVSLKDLPRGFSYPQLAKNLAETPNANEQTSRLVGLMGSVNYTYDNIYLADLTFRTDGSSAFGKDSRFAPFWSSGLGVNIHKFEFMQDISWISELRLRGSYGTTGKANFPARTARTVYTVDEKKNYPTGSGVHMAAMGNRKLKWEKTHTLDVGLSLSLFEGRFYINGSYYNRRTVDLISDINVSSSSGFTRYKENVGELLNQGFELSTRVKVLGSRKMQLYFTGNMAANKNRIEKISDALKAYNKEIEEKYKDIEVDNNPNKPFVKYEEGASTSSIYAMPSLGIDPQTGVEMFMYKDGTVSTLWRSSDNIAIGNSEPKLNGSFAINFVYAGFSLDAYFSYTYGGQQYNQTLQEKIENADITKNVDRRVLTDRWKKPGDITMFKSLKDYDVLTRPTSRFVQDENTLTLTSVSLGYDLPQDVLSKTFLEGVRFSFNMNDVFRISTIEQERGLSYPFARTFSFSANVRF